jgi:hypothetical protein
MGRVALFIHLGEMGERLSELVQSDVRISSGSDDARRCHFGALVGDTEPRTAPPEVYR